MNKRVMEIKRVVLDNDKGIVSMYGTYNKTKEE